MIYQKTHLQSRKRDRDKQQQQPHSKRILKQIKTIYIFCCKRLRLLTNIRIDICIALCNKYQCRMSIGLTFGARFFFLILFHVSSLAVRFLLQFFLFVCWPRFSSLVYVIICALWNVYYTWKTDQNIILCRMVDCVCILEDINHEVVIEFGIGWALFVVGIVLVTLMRLSFSQLFISMWMQLNECVFCF